MGEQVGRERQEFGFQHEFEIPVEHLSELSSSLERDVGRRSCLGIVTCRCHFKSQG